MLLYKYRYNSKATMASNSEVKKLINHTYTAGFVTDVDVDQLPVGLSEDVIRAISKKKNEPEFLLNWRLEAYRHWQTMVMPNWAHLAIEPIDFQAISYYSAPKSNKDGPKSLDEVDPALLRTYERLGIPLHEQKMLPQDV